METYIYYIEILSMVSLFLLYGLSVLLMLADDGDMRWTVLLNGLHCCCHLIYIRVVEFLGTRESIYIVGNSHIDYLDSADSCTL